VRVKNRALSAPFYMKKRFLAGLTSSQFMRRHWQKQALLAPRALVEYANTVGRDELFDLARRDDVESRIVTNVGRRWQVEHGPFARRRLTRLPRSGWTLLVQGVDQIVPGAARLLREFAFIPYARIDDVMVSYAAPGGGVGPHFDSYDVFLLQGAGERRWQVSRQRDLTLVDAPLKILKRFVAEREWIVGPGDLLYLPPKFAHDGVAIGECITYSIGFRAPSAPELGQHFLDYLQDRLDLEGMYEDPDLHSTRAPGRLPREMVERAASMLDALRWTRGDVERFMGAYLTEPKTNVVFARAAKGQTLARFAQRAARAGLRLALPTRMLTSGADVFINGESHRATRKHRQLFALLANSRRLPSPVHADEATLRLLYDWYRAGYIEVGADPAD
jgi:50S ribosomal protein L16 3-hydroxylase